MANTLVTHTSGNDSYGGGYTGNYAGTWADWHSSFGPVFAGTAATYTNSTTQIAKTGIGTASAVGLLAYVSGTNITSGHYEITDIISADVIEVSGITATGDNTDTVVNVGGALLTVKGMIDLLGSTDTGYLVESGTDYGVGTAITVTDGRTINLYGVKASDGSIWYTECGWNRPTIIATATIDILTFSTTQYGTLRMSGIEMDGGSTGNATACIVFDGNLVFYLSINDCKIGNATGKQIEGKNSSNMYGNIEQSEIYGGTYGVFGSAARQAPSILNSVIHSCTTAGIYYYVFTTTTHPSVTGSLIYNCGVGIHYERYGGDRGIIVSGSILDNTIDLQMEYLSTITQVVIANSLLYGTTAFDPDNEDTTVGFVAIGCLFRSGITKILAGAKGYVTQIGSRDLTGDPFVGPFTGTYGDTPASYRLDPTSADFAKLYDWTSGKSIGPLGPAPAPTFPAEADVLATADPYGWDGEYEGSSAGGSGGVIQGQGLHSIESGV